MPKRTKKQTKSPVFEKQFTLALNETDAGVLWLNSLQEDVFRDHVLEHLFRKMQHAGILGWYNKIHGRTDKGVDFLLEYRSDFGSRIIGIQAKSKEVTRTGAAGTYSSLEVKQECEAAMKHTFEVNKSTSRLDNIELWCSSHITEDAEKEFSAAGDIVKIQVKKASAIFSLVEKFCPDLLRKIPHCALANFVREKQSPPSKKLKLLGCELHPKKHFLEPVFSTLASESVSGLKSTGQNISKKDTKVQLSDIIFRSDHSLILAPELSGKTYLLEHIQCLIADAQAVPLLVTKESFAVGKPLSIYSIIAKQLGFYSPNDIEQLVRNVRVYLLVDNIGGFSEDVQSFLFAQNSQQIKVIATAVRSAVSRSTVEVFHMTGVNLGSVTRFLRALDVGLSDDKAFIDRAHSFISRTLASSGLPSTPFTISMMLAECENSPQKFNTPTMGRLIERFVEMQLGSHSDNVNNVDFETKSELLKKLGGRKSLAISLVDLRREVTKFIESSAHPHSLDDFMVDLRHSGVFTFAEDSATWSHPTLKQYYWVKNLIAKGRLGPITKRLQEDNNMTLAALTGSQLKNGGELIEILAKDLGKLKLPPPAAMVEMVNETGVFGMLRSDEAEEEWLAGIETGSRSPHLDQKTAHPIVTLAESNLISESQPSESTPPARVMTEVEVEKENLAKIELRKRLEPLITQMAEGKLHIAFNLAALLVNARGTKTQNKEACVAHILAATQFLGNWFREVIAVFFADKSHVRFHLEGARVFAQLQLTDRMIGDPFLVSVFKRMLARSKSDEETVMLLDLLLGCGEIDNGIIVKKLHSVAKLELIVGFYLRVAVLYFFRFHRDSDRRTLRELLKLIRKNCKTASLKAVAT